MQQREPNYQLCLPMFSKALAKNLSDLFLRDARDPQAVRACDASRGWFLNVNQSVVRGSNRNPAQMFGVFFPLRHLSPPYVVCRGWSGPGFARRVDHNRRQGSCVTAPPGLHRGAASLCLPHPDKESDLWLNERGSVSLSQAGRSQTNNRTTRPQLTQTWRHTRKINH